MKREISWNTENVEMPVFDREAVENWIEQVAIAHGKILGDISYLFCDDAKILEVNKQFLQHDYYTDIITFDYTRGKLLRGDMVISLDTVLTNSQMVGASYQKELLRVIIHGILHLCGINDKGPGEREIMEAHEDAALALINF